MSEILDSELLGEGLIPTLQHAHDNLLVENALTVPYRATTYGQVFKGHATFFCVIIQFLVLLNCRLKMIFNMLLSLEKCQ